MPQAAKRPCAAILLVLCLAAPGRAQERWKTQYFYDQRGSALAFRDIRCPSVTHCIATGVIDDNDHERGAVVTTVDGGQHWTVTNVKEHPVALYFRNDSLGWMVTDRGIWNTQDGARNWNKLESLKGLVEVYFLDESHGFAIGFPKAIYETSDGGRKWTKLEALAKVPGDSDHTLFDSIAFDGAHGLIAGSIDQSQPVPVRRNAATGELELAPGDDTVILETLDGGKNWAAKSMRVDGKLLKLSFAPEGELAAIVGYEGRKRQYPSAVFGARIGSNEGRSTIFAQTDRAVVDTAFPAHGRALIAAVEPTGNSTDIPIPGKLKMLDSDDLSVWREMPVDYRAVARGAVLAAPDADHAWVATDTGMILNLTRPASPPR